MNRNHAHTAAMVVVALAVVALPVALAFRAAHQLSVDAVSTQALALSREVLRRAEAAGDQSAAVTAALVAANDPDRCSDANIALMREADVASSYIQSVGAVSDGRLVCSSFGRHDPGFPLGPVAYVSSQGTRVRPEVQLPIALGARLLVLEKYGYAILVHQGLAIDVFTDRDVSVGIFGATSKARMLSRGPFEPQWTNALRGAGQTVTFDGKNVVAITGSRKYDYATYAAIPSRYVREGERAVAFSLVPVGAVLGLLFGVSLLLLARRRTSLPSLLRAALKRREFFLEYQPIVELATGRCVGAEALIRWQRPDGSFVRPGLFIPVAEDCKLIRKVTAQVMELLRADAATILAAHPDLTMSFNLAAEDLESTQIVEELRALLAKMPLLTGHLHIEMTERGMLNTDLAREIVRAVRELGIEVAIDDFGTGFCSLSYLTTFEVDYIKIDKAFVDTLGTAAATSQVAMHIIRMAADLSLKTIAEGVETELQANILRDAGVQYAQGWLYAKAMNPAALCEFVTASRQPR